ncbi:MAG: YDG domain-containing protein [Paludibacter sp.]
MRKTTFFKTLILAFAILVGSVSAWAVTINPLTPNPYLMSSGDYSETFTNIANTTNWPANFNGTDCTEWTAVAVNATGTIPDGKKTTVASTTFTTTTSGGVQRGTANLVLLSTGSTDNTSAVAVDLYLNFTGRNAGTLSFDWAQVANSTGDRKASLKVFTSTDGITFTELTAAAVLNVTNNVASSGSITSIALPASFNNATSTVIRFYEYNATGGTTGSRAKISIDNVAVTSTSAAATPPVVSAASPTGTVGTAFSYNISATNTPTSYALANSTTLPAGLSLNTTTGAITGTPTAAGSFSTDVTATNAVGTSSAATLSFTIAKASQTITFGALAAKLNSDADFSLTATASSGLTVSYSSSNPAVATITGSLVHIVGVGTTTITASQAGNTNYTAATSVDQILTVNQSLTPQTITFGALSSVTYGGIAFDLTATASSTLPVTYASSNTAVATVSGSTVTIIGAGSTNITASQAGNGSFNPAADVIQALTVNAKALTLPDAAATSKTYDGTNAAVITGTLTGIINSDNVTLTGTGTFADVNVADGIAVTSTSTLGGTKAANYTLTQPTGLTANITKANQTIILAATASKNVGDADYSLAATSATSATNALSYASSNTAVATINTTTGLVHVVAAGTTTLTVSQAASANYNAATDASQTLTISVAPQTLGAWNFTAGTATPSSVTTNVTISDLIQGNNNGTTTMISTTSASTGYTGASGTNNAGAASKTGVLNTAASGSAYFEFTVTPAAKSTYTLTGISFGSRSTTTGPLSFTLRSSADSYASDLTTGTLTNTSSWALQSKTGISSSASSAITYRIYGYNGTGSASANTANWRIDDLTLFGSVSVATPTITITEVLIPILTIAVPSSIINVSGTNLTDNITLAISGTNANLFDVNPKILTQTNGTVSNTAVTISYVNGGSNADTAILTLSSPGATSVTFQLNAGIWTALNNVYANLSVSASDGVIRFTAVAGQVMELYNAVGRKLLVKQTISGMNTIPVASKGLVIVKVGNQIAKVVL